MINENKPIRPLSDGELHQTAREQGLGTVDKEEPPQLRGTSFEYVITDELVEPGGRRTPIVDAKAHYIKALSTPRFSRPKRTKKRPDRAKIKARRKQKHR